MNTQTPIPNKDRIPWKRVTKAIRQRCAHTHPNSAHLENTLKSISAVVDDWFLSRPTMTAVGEVVACKKTDPVDIVSPVCFNSTNMWQKMNQPSELVEKHLLFIRKLRNCMNIGSTTFLFPVHASYQTENDTLFAQNLMKATAGAYDDDYTCTFMHEAIPLIANMEKAQREFISHDSEMIMSAEKLCGMRSRYYSNIGIPKEDWLAKTISTMAEYRALGMWAKRNNLLICTHTTHNISCYKSVGAPFLHNKVTFSGE